MTTPPPNPIHGPQLQSLQTELAKLQREREIDLALFSEQPLDLAAARALVHAALDVEKPEPLDAVVAKLRAAHPALFKPPARASSASGARSAATPLSALEHAAADALASGRRTELLHYLRLKRKKS
jgi:hypothetical protein